MLKIADFYLSKDDSYTNAILRRLQEDYATEEEFEDGRYYEVFDSRSDEHAFR